jgi:hypothetical protein
MRSLATKEMVVLAAARVQPALAVHAAKRVVLPRLLLKARSLKR